MRKNRWVVEAAAAAGVSNVVSARVVESLLRAIARELGAGAEVRLGRFGAFVWVDEPVERWGYVRGTRRVVQFRPGERLLDEMRP